MNMEAQPTESTDEGEEKQSSFEVSAVRATAIQQEIAEAAASGNFAKIAELSAEGQRLKSANEGIVAEDHQEGLEMNAEMGAEKSRQEAEAKQKEVDTLAAQAEQARLDAESAAADQAAAEKLAEEIKNGGRLAESGIAAETEAVSGNENNESLKPVYDEKLSDSFPGSVIVKRNDGVCFAIRKNGDSWEGNEFNLMSDGSIGAVYQVHNVPPEIVTIAETEISQTLPVLNRDLMKIGVASREEKARFVDAIRDLSQDTPVDLYHGLNGGVGSALGVLESEDHGIKKISGPCLAAYPVGQYWKPGDAGFRYSVPRSDIELPGESNPNAKFRMDDEGTVSMVNGLTSLPVSEYKGIVMRTERKVDVVEEELVDGVWRDVVVGEKVIPLTPEERMVSAEIQKKIEELSGVRGAEEFE